MATISANSLGVYCINPDFDTTNAAFSLTGTIAETTDLTKPIDILEYTGTFIAQEEGPYSGYAVVTLSSTVLNKLYLLINSSGDFYGLGLGSGSDSVYLFSSVDSLLQLVSAATSLSVEASNTVNETTAHNGSGGSTTYITSGAMSWSMSVDGLLDLSSAGVGSAITIMDAARAKYYTINKFNTGTNVNYIGQSLIDSISLSGGVDDIATYSASFSGYGDLYKLV